MILYSASETATEADEGSAVAEVRNLILERAGEVGLVSDDNIRSFVRRANRTVWKEAVKRNADAWKVRTPDILFPVTNDLALDIIGGANPDTAGDLAITFGAALVHKVYYIEVQYLGDYYPVGPLNNPEDTYIYEPGTKIFAGPHQPANWYIEGQKLKFTPPPLMPLTIRARYVPAIPDPVDQEHMLQGRYPQHHDCVSTLAACLCFKKDEKASSPWDSEYKQLLQQFMLDLAEPQGMQTRRVAPRGPYT
jgi:hypothetical protein